MDYQVIDIESSRERREESDEAAARLRSAGIKADAIQSNISMRFLVKIA